MSEQLHFHFSLSCTGEGNGSPLQCSCLENPRDGGAWWAAVYGVAQSWTRLKRLSSSSSSSRWTGKWQTQVAEQRELVWSSLCKRTPIKCCSALVYIHAYGCKFMQQLWKYYWVQARSAHRMTGEWIQQMRCLGKEGTLIWGPADREDGRLAPQMTILPRPGCQVLLWIRDGGEVRKQSKKTIQFLQISPRMASLRQGNMLLSLSCSPLQKGGWGYLPEASHYVCL